jgi:hypothetical protein
MLIASLCQDKARKKKVFEVFKIGPNACNTRRPFNKFDIIILEGREGGAN